MTRILLLGGGFAGIYTARRLEKLFAGRNDVEIILVSRDNFLLMTPLLFEVCSGTLEMSACSNHVERCHQDRVAVRSACPRHGRRDEHEQGSRLGVRVHV
jgi:NADH dehydrogenase FAD-containing subunit